MQKNIQQYELFNDVEAIILVADKEGRILFVNNAVKKILGYDPTELLGDGWWNLVSTKHESINRKGVVSEIAKGELDVDAVHLIENEIRTKDKKVVWTQWTSRVTSDQRVVGVAQDITAKKMIELEVIKNDKNKEVLLKEIHHRVKNNLQVIISLLNLQFETVNDKNGLEAMSKSKDRIYSMALIHSMLCRSEDLSSINFCAYAEELVEYIKSTLNNKKNIECKVEKSNIELSIDVSLNLGLIITELITNSFKHAFDGMIEGAIYIGLKSISPNRYELTVKDTGIGSDIEKLLKPVSLGLELVDDLIEQIGGKRNTRVKNGVEQIVQFTV